jgi:serine/threonine protein kinase
VWFFFYNPDWDPVEIAKRAAAAARPKTGYTRNHHLGSGSYGDVFSGTENATGRVVALKTASRQAQLGFRTRGLGPFADIAHEYKALNGLKHPNLIGFLGFVGIAGTPCEFVVLLAILASFRVSYSPLNPVLADIVMEYANGGAFDDWIPKYRKENGHFPSRFHFSSTTSPVLRLLSTALDEGRYLMYQICDGVRVGTFGFDSLLIR